LIFFFSVFFFFWTRSILQENEFLITARRGDLSLLGLEFWCSQRIQLRNVGDDPTEEEKEKEDSSKKK
jgi:hypothetical protein